MRHIYALIIACAAVLLLGLAVNSAIGAGVSPRPVNPASVGIQALDYVRKLPPPPGTVKVVPADPNYRPLACVAPVVNVSQESGNQSESFVVVNPTNPSNVVAFSNEASASNIFRGYSTDSGATWTRGTVATGVACCDGQAVYDSFGNLFLVYINGAVNQINVILSTDGGVTFSAPVTAGTGSVDQPSIAVGSGSVWVDWNSSGNMVARGAPVTGLGTWGPFGALQAIPSASGSFGGIAVGPGPNGGKVMVTYMSPTSGQGPATIFVNVDADGLGAGGFGPQITATTTNVGGFDFIPAQSGRSIDAEPGLVWDRTGGPFNNRVYLIYSEETVNENNDTDTMVRTSTDDGTTWTAPVRVNDDPSNPIRSQFLPYIALDPTTGTVAAGWHDARNDNGVPGSGGTNNIPNDDSEYYASYTTDGGATWAPNVRLSGGFSNAAAAANGIDYGDYVGQSAYGGKFYAVWADNANCDGTNANGTLHAFDLYMGVLTLPAGGTPTPTVTGTPPTSTRTRTPTSTVPATNTPTATATSCSTGAVTNGGFETGTLPPWVVLGTNPPPVVSNAVPHSGTYSALLGTVSGTEPNGDGSMYQTITVPASGGTLSYWWNGGTTDTITFDWQDAYVTNTSGTILATIQHTCSTTGGWQNQTFNMAPYAGQTVRIEFLVHQDGFGDDTYMYVDDVALLTACTTATPGGATNTATPLLSTNTSTRTATSSAPTSTATSGAGATNTPTTAAGTPTAVSTSQTTATSTSTAGGNTATRTPPATSPAGSATSTPTAGTPTATYTVCPIQFTDVPNGSTFYPYIRCLACRGIVSGYADGTFRPNNNVTRGQLSKIVSNSAGFSENHTTQDFQDVPVGSNFYIWIERLYSRGIIGGYPCGGPFEPCGPGNLPYFRPNANATRGQITKIDANAAGYSDPPVGQQFQDVPPGSTFYTYTYQLVTRGIMSGYPCSGPGEPCVPPGNLPYFRPNNNATRGQTAKIVANTFFPNCQTPQAVKQR